MQRNPSSYCLVLFLLLGLGHARLVHSEAPAQPKIIPSRQRGFSIPFAVRPAPSSREAPREVFLYVSSNRGAEWKLVARVEPKAGHFMYQARADGEYWFLVRTVNQDGQVITPGATTPELKVLVDTEPPSLQLSARELPSGEIEASLQCHDLHLDTSSLKVEYPVASDGSWQAVEVDVNKLHRQGDTTKASAVWRPDGLPRALTVRAAVSDQAGNRSTARTVLDNVSVDSRVVAKPTEPAALQFARVAQSGVGSTTRDDTSTGDPNRIAPPPAFRSDGSTVWPRDQVSDTPLTVNQQSDAQTPDSSTDPLAPRSRTAAVRYRTSADAGPDRAIQPHVVRARTFHLEYDVGQSGGAAVAKAELWGTLDAGRTWEYFGTDIDRRSPFVVTVPGAGLYGFRLIVQAANMPAEAAPTPGQLPEMWVLVHDSDVTPPNQ
jgi:hypothetical protein